jgi:alpha-galactosidase
MVINELSSKQEMSMTKIVLIGGGSYAWAPTIIRDIVVTDDLEGSTIVLHDIDAKSLDVMLSLGKMMIERSGKKFGIEATTNRRQALQDAEFMVLTISTGGLEAMRHDLEIPLKYGIYQSVGDTVGPGGISRTLRNIPVVLEMAKDMDDLCPDAWFINYSNPMTTICRAVTKTTKIKTIGLCHGLNEVVFMLRSIFEVKRDNEMYLKAAGINHLPWIIELSVRGEDGFQLLREYIRRNGISISPVKLELFKIYGCLPGTGDRHVAEFFPYFLTKEAGAGSKYGVRLTTIEDRYRGRERQIEIVNKMLSGEIGIEMKKSAETASNIISAIVNGRYEVEVLNLPNKGQVNNLQREAIVETYGLVGPGGAEGIAIGDVPPAVQAILHQHIVKHELTVEASLKGDRELALQAMLLDPLVRDFETAGKMLDELLEANKGYLPQFFDKG